MPEGDTIFRAARALNRALAGDVVSRFETGYAHLARVHDDTPVTGRRVESVSSRGKHLLVRFSEDLVLRTHLRMKGSWHIYRPGEPWQRHPASARIVLGTERFVAVAFDVTDAAFHTERSLARDRRLARLGPDLLGTAFDEDEALRRFRSAGSVPIGEALVNQSVVAGAGNVFKSEILFLARLSPFEPTDALEDERLLELVRLGRRLLDANVAPSAGNGLVTSTGLRRTTRRGDPSARLWVYGRRGKPCRACGTWVRARKQGIDARTTFWCPKCQPGEAPA